MPEIVFKGKEYVYNHHLTVPYRPLVDDKAKGISPGDLNSNPVIRGDDLHALKALLPRYAGQVDLVFIDPLWQRLRTPIAMSDFAAPANWRWKAEKCPWSVTWCSIRHGAVR